LREPYNLAVSEKRAAEATLAALPAEESVGRHELEAMICGLHDMAQALDRAAPEDLAELYAPLRLSLTYHHAEQVVDVVSTHWPTVWLSCVSEGGHAP
jgi:hypothetical protein